jgi:hypothetical protein
MHIDKRLNLVIVLQRADEDDENDTTPPIYVHCTPLLLETVKTYHMVLAKAFSALMSERLSVTAGPSVAAYTLEEVAKTTYRSPGVSWWEGPDGVEQGLFAEMRRLSNVILPRQNGWGMKPLQMALDGDSEVVLGPDEATGVMNQLAFFMVISAIAPVRDRSKLIKGGAYLYDGQTTLLSSTDYTASLMTSTVAGITGANAQVSSIPH